MTTPIVRTGLRIPYEQNTKIIFIARKIGISKNALILQILREWLEKQEKSKADQERG